MSRFFRNYFVYVFALAFFVFGFLLAEAQFKGPCAAPPDCNTPAPLDTSGEEQHKGGRLILERGLDVWENLTVGEPKVKGKLKISDGSRFCMDKSATGFEECVGYWDDLDRVLGIGGSGAAGLWGKSFVDGAETDNIFYTTGNVGIGDFSKASPGYKLHVLGDTRSSGWVSVGGGLVLDSKGDLGRYYIDVDKGGAFRVVDYTDEDANGKLIERPRLVIDEDGNVMVDGDIDVKGDYYRGGELFVGGGTGGDGVWATLDGGGIKYDGAKVQVGEGGQNTDTTDVAIYGDLDVGSVIQGFVPAKWVYVCEGVLPGEDCTKTQVGSKPAGGVSLDDWKDAFPSVFSSVGDLEDVRISISDVCVDEDLAEVECVDNRYEGISEGALDVAYDFFWSEIGGTGQVVYGYKRFVRKEEAAKTGSPDGGVIRARSLSVSEGVSAGGLTLAGFNTGEYLKVGADGVITTGVPPGGSGGESLWDGARGEKIYTMDKVGIGTDEPTQELEVDGVVKASNFYLPRGERQWRISDFASSFLVSSVSFNADGSVQGTSPYLLISDSGLVSLGNSVARADLKVSGRVGIGIIGGSRPEAELDVRGSVRAEGFVLTGDGFREGQEGKILSLASDGEVVLVDAPAVGSDVWGENEGVVSLKAGIVDSEVAIGVGDLGDLAVNNSLYVGGDFEVGGSGSVQINTTGGVTVNPSGDVNLKPVGGEGKVTVGGTAPVPLTVYGPLEVVSVLVGDTDDEYQYKGGSIVLVGGVPASEFDGGFDLWKSRKPVEFGRYPDGEAGWQEARIVDGCVDIDRSSSECNELSYTGGVQETSKKVAYDFSVSRSPDESNVLLWYRRFDRREIQGDAGEMVGGNFSAESVNAGSVEARRVEVTEMLEVGSDAKVGGELYVDGNVVGQGNVSVQGGLNVGGEASIADSLHVDSTVNAPGFCLPAISGGCVSDWGEVSGFWTEGAGGGIYYGGGKVGIGVADPEATLAVGHKGSLGTGVMGRGDSFGVYGSSDGVGVRGNGSVVGVAGFGSADGYDFHAMNSNGLSLFEGGVEVRGVLSADGGIRSTNVAADGYSVSSGADVYVGHMILGGGHEVTGVGAKCDKMFGLMVEASNKCRCPSGSKRFKTGSITVGRVAYMCMYPG